MKTKKCLGYSLKCLPVYLFVSMHMFLMVRCLCPHVQCLHELEFEVEPKLSPELSSLKGFGSMKKWHGRPIMTWHVLMPGTYCIEHVDMKKFSFIY